MVKKYLETSRKIFAVHLESCCSTLGHISCAVASMAVTLLAMCSSRKVLSSAATCRPIRGEHCGHVTALSQSQLTWFSLAATWHSPPSRPPPVLALVS